MVICANDDQHLSVLIYKFYTRKYKQRLLYPYDIDVLISDYLNQLNV